MKERLANSGEMVLNFISNVAPSHLSPLSGVTHCSPRSSPGARAFSFERLYADQDCSDGFQPAWRASDSLQNQRSLLPLMCTRS